MNKSVLETYLAPFSSMLTHIGIIFILLGNT